MFLFKEDVQLITPESKKNKKKKQELKSAAIRSEGTVDRISGTEGTLTGLSLVNNIHHG